MIEKKININYFKRLTRMINDRFLEIIFLIIWIFYFINFTKILNNFIFILNINPLK